MTLAWMHWMPSTSSSNRTVQSASKKPFTGNQNFSAMVGYITKDAGTCGRWCYFFIFAHFILICGCYFSILCHTGRRFESYIWYAIRSFNHFHIILGFAPLRPRPVIRYTRWWKETACARESQQFHYYELVGFNVVTHHPIHYCFLTVVLTAVLCAVMVSYNDLCK